MYSLKKSLMLYFFFNLKLAADSKRIKYFEERNQITSPKFRKIYDHFLAIHNVTHCTQLKLSYLAYET